MNRTLRIAQSLTLFAVMTLLPRTGQGEPPAKLPDTVHLPAGADVKDLAYWRFDQFEFASADGAPDLHTGKRWHAHLYIDALQAGTDARGVWAKFKSALAATGWTPVQDTEKRPTLHLQSKGVDAWLRLTLAGAEADIDLIESAPPPSKIALHEPAATPEPVDSAKGDFPWLAPLPGSTLARSEIDNHPIMVALAGSSTLEAIGTASLLKIYHPAERLSNVEFLTVYGEALTHAGWTIVSRVLRGDCNLTAHYDKHGRNLWAYLRSAPFDDYLIQVVDLGDLASTLGKECHATLHGVFFDFNQSTLKPESDPVLKQVAALLAKKPVLKLEVQGHTDAVGNDASNQTLSEARARAVVAWLIAHGGKAEHLMATGYGKTRPIADNTTDEGRAKNRRVEIADTSCKPR